MTIDSLTYLDGAITGTLRVIEPANLEIRKQGSVSKDLIVEFGTIVQIYGSVGGNIYLKGGQLEIWGKVKGSIYRETGSLFLYREAKLEGKVTTEV
ncbi:MAG: polymer-forming cytoskeletal protein [Nitrososphaera sp.]|nr:polymer-forming cytoskeletal protein [Nitrososphaera sp.]